MSDLRGRVVTLLCDLQLASMEAENGENVLLRLNAEKGCGKIKDALMEIFERGRKAEEELAEIWAIATDAKNSNTPQATAINRIYEIADRVLGGEKKEGE